MKRLKQKETGNKEKVGSAEEISTTPEDFFGVA